MLYKIRKLITIICVVTAINAFAAHHQLNTPGFYIGTQGGWSSVNYPNNFAPGFTASSTNGSGLATRVYGGFNITNYFGVETGVAYLHKPHFYNINNILSSKIKNNIVFLMAKGILPLNARWTTYADFGIGYIARSWLVVEGVRAFDNQEIVRPVYGVGVAYLLWPRWSADLTWIQAAKKSSNHLPASNFFGIGIRYKFS